MIYLNALALRVRAVVALFRVKAGHALVEFETEIFESVDYRGDAVGDLAFFVGVLYSQISQPAADSRRQKIDKRAEQAAYMEISRRARRESGHTRPLGKLARGVSQLALLRRQYVRAEEEIGEFFVISH